MPTLLTNTFYTLVFAIASGTVRSLLTPGMTINPGTGKKENSIHL
ncbi:hypothetical protein [Nostoc sp.]